MSPVLQWGVSVLAFVGCVLLLVTGGIGLLHFGDRMDKWLDTRKPGVRTMLACVVYSFMGGACLYALIYATHSVLFPQ